MKKDLRGVIERTCDEHEGKKWTWHFWRIKTGECQTTINSAYVPCGSSTLYRWTNDHTEFRDAKSAGTQMGLAFWEQLGIAAAAGKLKGFNSTVWTVTMKNRFGYRDKIEGKLEIEKTERLVHDVQIGLEGQIINVSSEFTPEELKAVGVVDE
jgi:hypothetical protein